MKDARERFFMSMFITAYVGIFLCIFFWEMAGVSWLCRVWGLPFRPALIALTAISVNVYMLRTRVFFFIDGITGAGVLAAAVSSFFMGQGTGSWLLETRFLTDLAIMTMLLLGMMFVVYLYSSKEIRNFRSGREEGGRDEPGGDDDRGRS